jgi:hypothetical protein
MELHTLELCWPRLQAVSILLWQHCITVPKAKEVYDKTPNFDESMVSLVVG